MSIKWNKTEKLIPWQHNLPWEVTGRVVLRGHNPNQKSSTHLQCRNPRCACLKLLGYPGKHRNMHMLHDWDCTLSSWVISRMNLHYGKCRIQCFWSLVHKSQDISASAASITLDTKYVHLQFTYLSVLAGFSDGFRRKSVLDQNTNGLPGAHENTHNRTIFY